MICQNDIKKYFYQEIATTSLSWIYHEFCYHIVSLPRQEIVLMILFIVATFCA